MYISRYIGLCNLAIISCIRSFSSSLQLLSYSEFTKLIILLIQALPAEAVFLPLLQHSTKIFLSSLSLLATLKHTLLWYGLIAICESIFLSLVQHACTRITSCESQSSNVYLHRICCRRKQKTNQEIMRSKNRKKQWLRKRKLREERWTTMIYKTSKITNQIQDRWPMKIYRIRRINNHSNSSRCTFYGVPFK